MNGFVRYQTDEAGIRAAAIVLRTYRTKHGLTTAREVIERYAPPSENDTASYINAVLRDIGGRPDDPVKDWQKLLWAMLRHESLNHPSLAQVRLLTRDLLPGPI